MSTSTANWPSIGANLHRGVGTACNRMIPEVLALYWLHWEEHASRFLRTYHLRITETHSQPSLSSSRWILDSSFPNSGKQGPRRMGAQVNMTIIIPIRIRIGVRDQKIIIGIKKKGGSKRKNRDSEKKC